MTQTATTPPSHPPHRGSIIVEDATVLANQDVGAGQHIMRLRAPQITQRAAPGAFVHIRCHDHLPMRRPMSIMRAHVAQDAIEVLFKRVGKGTQLLAEQAQGTQLSVMGPIGHCFECDPARPLQLLIGGGVGIPPMIFLAERLRAANAGYKPLVLMGSEIPFPFTPRPSAILVDGIPPATIASMPLLDDWGIPSRLASGAGFAGCFAGHVPDLAAHWLERLTQSTLAKVQIHACGPTPMLRATSSLAQRFNVPSQLSLEEFMACAVGGCAGCTVRVRTSDGAHAMKRVCVDGPIFSGDDIVWDT